MNTNATDQIVRGILQGQFTYAEVNEILSAATARQAIATTQEIAKDEARRAANLNGHCNDENCACHDDDGGTGMAPGTDA